MALRAAQGSSGEGAQRGRGGGLLFSEQVVENLLVEEGRG